MYIRPLGCFVVDYCLDSKEEYVFFNKIEVSTVCDLEVSLDYQSKLVSDHSILSWMLFQNVPRCIENISLGRNMKKAKKVLITDLRKIPPHFLYSREKYLFLLAEWLHSNSINQYFLDNIYNNFCNILQTEIQNTISVRSHFQSNYKKPWWNQSLKRERKKR